MKLGDLFESYEDGSAFWRDLSPHFQGFSKVKTTNAFPTWPPSEAELRRAERDILQNPEWLAVWAYAGWRNWAMASEWRFDKHLQLFRFEDVPQIGVMGEEVFPDRSSLYLDLDGAIRAPRPTPYGEHYVYLPTAIDACRTVVRVYGSKVRENLPYLTGTYYVRFGRWPENERSRNWLFRDEEVYEEGVSAYNATFDVQSGRWVLEVVDDAATSGTMQHLIYGTREVFLVTGREIGEGADGEPLLHDVRLVKRLRNTDVFVPGMFDPAEDLKEGVEALFGGGDRLDPEARRFGIWLTHLHWQRYPDIATDEVGVFNYSGEDDEKGRPLRYRMVVDADFRDFVRSALPEIERKGWHLTVELPRGRGRWQLVFEPKLAPRVRREGVFWHLTPKANVASILRDGLRPSGSRHGFDFPQPRVYLIRQREHASRMVDSLSKRDKERIDYTLLKVDLRRAKGVRLHTDPELAAVAVYATTPVPPEMISVADESVEPLWR